jgi:hypothetical protein
VVVGTMLAGVPPVLAQIPAFPGAQGPGATATGGRGGDVYHVTRLDFDNNGTIPGTLRYGINTAPSAGRTIVFDVGGTIYQGGGGSGWWFRSGKSNITVAGQTAPGAGITIAGVATKWTGNNNILRNITVRPNKDPANPTNFTYDAFSLQLTNSIVDHVTATWFTDEGISLTDAGNNTTVQYANISEGLNYDGHSFGSIIATEVDGAHYSYHHNLYGHNNSRMPRLGSATGTTGAVLNFSNNVVYNWQNKAGYSGTVQHSSSNFIGNYYIKGNNNGITAFDGGDDASSVGFTRIFQNKSDPALANKYDYNKNGVFDGTAFGPGDVQPGTSNKYYAGSTTFVSTPFTVNGVATPDTADLALQRVLDYGGANWQNRNPIDQRIINSVKNGTGNLVNDLTSGAQASEWATVLAQRPNAQGVAPFTRPANWDTDGDGMPNAWETSLGLNPSVANNNGDFDSDGYSDLEEYINELAAWPAPRPIVFSGGNGRYALINNWDIKWQPSRYDTAKITNGATARVDARGQHAGVLQIGEGGAGALALDSGWIRVHQLLRVRETGVVQFNGGAIDLAAGAAIFDYSADSPLNALTDQLQSGRAGGAWNGPGIHSSAAGALPGTGVGVVEASDLGVTSFEGQSVDGTTVLMRWTLVGDTELNGLVDVADLGRLASNWQSAGSWFDGDFDYNGTVDVNDLGLLASNWQAGAGSPLGPGLVDALSALGLPVTSVPEPALMSLLGMIPWSLRRPGRARHGQPL